MDSEFESVYSGWKCHITGKFPTEGQRMIAKDYFDKFMFEVTSLRHSDGELSWTKMYTGKHSVHRPKISPDLLCYKGEPPKLRFDPQMNSKKFVHAIKVAHKKVLLNNELSTVQHRREDLEKRGCNGNLKYACTLFCPLPEPKVINNAPPDTNGCLIFSFRVYRPFLSKGGRAEDINLSQEILLLGTQTLRDLGSTIACPMMHGGLRDISDQGPTSNEEINSVVETVKNYPSCFFFIDRTFYVNGPPDLSAPLRPFLKGGGFGTFAHTDVDQQVDSIPLQVGRPYVFQHLGQCEHVLMVSDIRLRANDDIKGSHNYPLVHSVSNCSVRTCMLCARDAARWMVTDFPNLTVDRAFLCQRCFLSFCYVDGLKVSNFKAYLYLDMGAIV